MSGKIGVAILGSGIFVKEEHLPAVQASSTLTLKAIASRTLKSAQNVASSLPDIALYSEDSPASANYAALFARPDIAAVIIALPITVQPHYIKQALTAGKHVLAEKPIAQNVATARALLDWYHAHIDTAKVTLGIAEQFRYLEDFALGARRAREFGNVLGFRVRFGSMIQAGSKYYETAWRKKPEYQGGFLLDGGVHYVAGMRVLLGPDAKVEKLSAFTAQLQEHLPPVDTVDATLKLTNGSTGNISVSFGTTFSGYENSIACEGGSVVVTRNRVVSKPKGGDEKVEEVDGKLGGVELEVFAWAESLVRGSQDPQQSPEQALADLEVLESMLKSGESDGQPIELKYQI